MTQNEHKDFSLKQGEKITMNIKGVTGKGPAGSGPKVGGGLKKLGMPSNNKPSGGNRRIVPGAASNPV